MKNTLKNILRSLLLVLCFLFADSASAQVIPYYSEYTSLSTDGTDVFQTINVDGYAESTPGWEVFMFSAQHTPRIINILGLFGGVTIGPGSCATCFISYSTTVVALNPGVGVIGDGHAGSSVQCQAFGAIWDSGGGTGGRLFPFRIAVTREASLGTQSNCLWLVGPLKILECNIDSVPWCTTATTPPDMHLSPTRWQVYPIPPPPFWDTYAVCVRSGSLPPWLCSKGVSFPLPSPQVPNICTKSP